MILEGLLTTLDDDGSPHLAPMGPLVAADMTQLTLRPFHTSHSYRNLKRSGQGVFHTTDDVELLARAAIHQVEVFPRTFAAHGVAGVVLADACHWYAIRVRHVDERDDRATLRCQVVADGRLRDFLGFNRAKHAVVEAAILATRVAHLDPRQILDEFQRLRVLVEKTGGPQEHRGFELLASFVRRSTEMGE